MSTFSNRLRDLRREKKMTQDELAKVLGISKSAVSMYENGNREPDFETLEAIADFFNVDMNYLLGKQSIKSASPIFDVAAGEGRINDGTPTNNIRGIMLEDDQSFANVHGRSMEPTLYDGDIVIVEATNVVESEHQIALVKINGDEATLKRVQVGQDGLTLIGDNPSVYPPRYFTARQVNELPITIEGVVVKLIREI